jgi:hypothetical protein
LLKLRVLLWAMIPPETGKILVVLVANGAKLKQFISGKVQQPTIKQVDDNNTYC